MLDEEKVWSINESNNWLEFHYNWPITSHSFRKSHMEYLTNSDRESKSWFALSLHFFLLKHVFGWSCVQFLHSRIVTFYSFITSNHFFLIALTSYPQLLFSKCSLMNNVFICKQFSSSKICLESCLIQLCVIYTSKHKLFAR